MEQEEIVTTEAQSPQSVDEAVCRVLGWRPRQEWMISRDGGKSMSAWTDRHGGSWETKADLEKYLERLRHFDSFAGAEILPLYIWPAVTSDAELAVKAMETCAREFGTTFQLGVAEMWHCNHLCDASFPMVVCMAILAAHEEKRDG